MLQAYTNKVSSGMQSSGISPAPIATDSQSETDSRSHAKMNIGIIGSGNMGTALGAIWARAGHSVSFAFSRSPEKLAQIAEATGHGATATSVAEAVNSCDVLFISVWPGELSSVFSSPTAWAGKIIISCSSGLRPDFSGQTVGLPTDLTKSVAETIAALVPEAHVVEAFNLTFAETLKAPDRDFKGQRPTVCYCGDTPSAKAIAHGLIEAAGYEAIDAGGISTARAMETLATAWVQFAAVSGLFPNLALKALRR
jgi:8-hydroxy-5-deazaflavin:NADPH oxidoreductase